MLTPPPEPAAALFVRAYMAGADWQAVLIKAGVSRSTWWRIERGGSYLSSTLDRITKALDDYLAEHQAPDPGFAPATTQETAHGATSG